MPTRITPNDIDIFTSLARLKLLTVRQIQGLHFSGPKRKRKSDKIITKKELEIIAAKRCAQLEAAGFLESRFAPLNSAQTKKVTRPSKVLFFPPKCQRNVRKHLEKAEKGSSWEIIAAEISSFNKSQTFSQTHLAHETGISEVFIHVDSHDGRFRLFHLDICRRPRPLPPSSRSNSFVESIAIHA